MIGMEEVEVFLIRAFVRVVACAAACVVLILTIIIHNASLLTLPLIRALRQIFVALW